MKTSTNNGEISHFSQSSKKLLIGNRSISPFSSEVKCLTSKTTLRAIRPAKESLRIVSALCATIILLASISASAQMQWYRHLSGTTESSIRDLIASPESGKGVIITGRFSGTINFNGSGSGAAVSKTAVGKYDMFVAQYSLTGTLNWVKTFGSSVNPTYVEGLSLSLVRTSGTTTFNGVTISGSIDNPNDNGNRTIDFNPAAPGGEFTTTNSNGNGFIILLNLSDGAYLNGRILSDELYGGNIVREQITPTDAYTFTFCPYPDKIYKLPTIEGTLPVVIPVIGARYVDLKRESGTNLVVGGSNINSSNRPMAVIDPYTEAVKGYFGQTGTYVSDLVIVGTSATTLTVYATLYGGTIPSSTYEIHRYNLTTTGSSVSSSLAWRKVINYHISGSQSTFLSVGGSNLFVAGWFQGATDFNYSGTSGGTTKIITSSGAGADFNSTLASYNASTGACNWAGNNTVSSGYGASVGLSAINTDVYFAGNGIGTMNVKLSGTAANIMLSSQINSWITKFATNSTTVPARMSANVYPNPSPTMIKVELEPETSFSEGTVALYDARGKEIKTQKINRNQLRSVELSLEGVAAGKYIILIKTKDFQESRQILIN
jgi:hypothetical protein